MHDLNSKKLAFLGCFANKKNLLYGVLVVTSLMTGKAAHAFDFTGEVPAPISIEGVTYVDGEALEWTADLNAVGVMFDPENPESVDVKYKQTDPLSLKAEDGDRITIGNLGNILDPTGSFSLRYTDVGTPSSFFTTITFAPFAPTMTGLVNFTGSVSGSVTDGSISRDGVSYQPIAPNASVFTYSLFDLNNTTVASFGLDAGTSFLAGPPDTHATGPFAGGLIAECGAVGCGTVQVTAGLLGSGGTDRYAFTGRWDAIEPPALIESKDYKGKKIFLTWDQYRKVVLRLNSAAVSTPEPAATVPLVLLGLAGMWRLRKPSSQSSK